MHLFFKVNVPQWTIGLLTFKNIFFPLSSSRDNFVTASIISSLNEVIWKHAQCFFQPITITWLIRQTNERFGGWVAGAVARAWLQHCYYHWLTNHMTFRNVSTSFLWISLFEVFDWIQMFSRPAFYTFLSSNWTQKPSINHQILVYVQSALIFVESLYDSELNRSYRASSLFSLFVCLFLFCFFALDLLLKFAFVFCV